MRPEDGDGAGGAFWGGADTGGPVASRPTLPPLLLGVGVAFLLGATVLVAAAVAVGKGVGLAKGVMAATPRGSRVGVVVGARGGDAAGAAPNKEQPVAATNIREKTRANHLHPLISSRPFYASGAYYPSHQKLHHPVQNPVGHLCLEEKG